MDPQLASRPPDKTTAVREEDVVLSMFDWFDDGSLFPFPSFPPTNSSEHGVTVLEGLLDFGTFCWNRFRRLFPADLLAC